MEKHSTPPMSASAYVNQQLADYAMAFDLVGRIARVATEDKVIKQAFELFTMLCAPGRISYLQYINGEPKEMVARPASSSDEETIKSRLMRAFEGPAWVVSESGFILRISHDDTVLGILEVEGISFVQYKDHYLNLGINLVGVIALAISNARFYQDLVTTKDALHENERRLRQQAELLEHAPVLVRTIDDEIILWNSGMRRLYGWTRSEAMGKTSHELLQTRFPQPLHEITDALQREGHWEGELHHRRSDGQSIIVASLWVLHTDEHGTPAAIIEINTDITERKRAESELQKHHLKLEILSETARQLLTSESPERIVQTLCERVMEHLDCHAFFNYLVDGTSQRMRLNAYAGITEATAREIEWLDFGVAVCGCVARDGCRIVAEDIPNTPDARTALVRSFGIQAYACHPLIYQGRIIGTLSFGTRSRSHFRSDELELMKTVADQAATAMARKQAEERIRHQNAVLEGINRIFRESLICETEEALGRICLVVAEEVTESKFGFIGELNAVGELGDIAISGPSWTACRMENKTGHRKVPTGFTVHGIYGRVLLDGKSFFTNDPASHPDSIGMPDGHPELKTFLGVPLIHGGKTIGMVGLGNREGGYRQEDLDAMEALGIAIVQVFMRSRAEKAVRRSEERLKHQVIQIQAANKELEAFSYSVSHDLRAPLRSIAGFGQVLLEDHADKLSEEGRDALNRMLSATHRMGQLIDDLLTLSRVTRAEMQHERVDLSALARKTAARIRDMEPDRQIEFIIDEDLFAEGDERLLSVVLENLLSNAVKFTTKKELPRIEFSLERHAGRPVHLVKDNGAGFDMTYADKLFNPFQRLHAAHEFPGTGIGLATVKRIIERHGGDVWIEGAVDKGAVVYFTLNER